MTPRPDLDHDLDHRLRRTLAAVADTVQDQPIAQPAVSLRRSRRRLLVGAGAGDDRRRCQSESHVSSNVDGDRTTK